jgi:hypothetical protein
VLIEGARAPREYVISFYELARAKWPKDDLTTLMEITTKNEATSQYIEMVPKMEDWFIIKKFSENQDWCAYGTSTINLDFPIFFLGTENNGKKIIQGEIFLPHSSISKGLGYYSFPGLVNPSIIQPERTYLKQLRTKSAYLNLFIFLGCFIIFAIEYIIPSKFSKSKMIFSLLAISVLIGRLIEQLLKQCE